MAGRLTRYVLSMPLSCKTDCDQSIQ